MLAAPGAGAVAFAGVVEPEHVLALQRTAGNRAACRLLGRTKKDPSGAAVPISAGDVTYTGGTPTVTGSARAEQKQVGPGHTRVFGPSMNVAATVSLAAGVELATNLTVGYIQNMTKADRVAVYTDDGTPTGTVVAELHTSVAPGTRDAEAHFKEDKNRNLVRDKDGNPVLEADTGPPWFASPGVIMTGVTPPAPADVKAKDTPSFPVALETETAGGKKGKLASVRGGEAFAIALAIKDGEAAPINLVAATWGIDWSMTIDPILHTGSGKAGAAPQPMNPAQLTPGEGLSHRDARQWSAPVDDAEANAMTLSELVRSLPAAREHDGAAYHRIVNAIHRRSNPEVWHAHIIVEDNESWGGDDIEIAMEGVRGVKRMGTIEGSEGDRFYRDWRLYDLFDPHDITYGSSIKVTIARAGEKAQERTWVFPFGSTDRRSHRFTGDAKYSLMMSFA